MTALDLTPALLRVWRRNLVVYLHLWKSELVMPFLEPILYLVAFGWGIGALVQEVEGMSYLQFFAPGMLAASVMWAAGFECSYGTFIRMEYQRLFEAITATPISFEEVVVGEMLWGATKALMGAIAILLIMTVLGLVPSPLGLASLAVAVLGGLAFAALSMLVTSLAPSISFFNYYIYLVLSPMFLFAGVFYPLSNLPGPVQVFAWFLPLTHIARAARGLVLGQGGADILVSLAWLAVFSLLVGYLAVIRMRARLVR